MVIGKTSVVCDPTAPSARTQFAMRLRQLRIARGFSSARHFSQALGIEENRYTRYERAEVEPSLTLLRKMCEALRASPNDLLAEGSGVADAKQQHSVST